MSIIAHPTQINSTTGRQTDAIVTTNLTGEWRASTGGAQTHYWDNEVGSGNNLRKYNSIAKTNSGSLHYWTPDGTNDYLGAASADYGGSPFTIASGSAFTLAQWYRHITNKNHVAFSLNASNSDVMKLTIGIDSENKFSLTASQTADEFNYTFANGTWYYIALVYHGSNNYSFFVNGSFVGAASNTTGSQTCNLQIGKLAASTTYTESGPRFGDVHVYNAAVGGSVLRTNFDAIHKPYNTRLFGDSFTAGS